MRTYSQLTRGKRYQIRALLKAGFSQSKMAFLLRVHRSTISREIRRNTGDKGYRPRQAHEKALTRRYAAAKRIKMTPVMMELVEHFIRQDFSPEQVSGYLARKHKIKISHETIYNLNLAPIDEEIERNHLGFLLLLGLRNHKPIMRRYPDGKTQETKYQEKA